jgi:hypothetical protein
MACPTSAGSGSAFPGRWLNWACASYTKYRCAPIGAVDVRRPEDGDVRLQEHCRSPNFVVVCDDGFIGHGYLAFEYIRSIESSCSKKEDLLP